ncbi:hypothetical protein Tco_1548784 [Tanacetum coccineum]
MDQDSAYMVAASKAPMLKPGEFKLWRMRIKQYIQMIDCALRELKFNSIKDSKQLLKAVEQRFGGNADTKKTQRNLLKQQYENFTAPSSEMLDQTARMLNISIMIGIHVRVIIAHWPVLRTSETYTMSTYEVLDRTSPTGNVANLVMPDSEDSTVTYTAVSSPFEGLSDIGSSGVDGLPMMLEDPYVEAVLQSPPSLDYVPGPEYPPSLEFVLEPVYPEFMPPEDEVFPAEEQPLPAAVSPTADLPGYITDSDPEEDKEDPREYPIDYPADKGYDDDDDDESSDDYEDDDDDVEEDDDEEEEEHPTPADSVPPLVHCVTARMSIREAGVSEVTLPPWKRLYIALGPRYEVSESSSAPTARPTRGFRADYGFVATLDNEIRQDPERYVGYGITNTWNDMVEDMQGTLAATDVAGLSQRMTDFVTTVRQDTDEIYVRLDDAHDDRSLMSGRLNMLFRDRRAHSRTTLLMERTARLSREAWGRSMDANDTACSEVRALRTTILAQQTEIVALRAADRARQAQLVETLRLISTLQTHVTVVQGQQGPASGPAQTEILEEAGSSS